MEVKILKEAGYEEAVKGIGLSYGITEFDRLKHVAEKLSPQEGGHNKFLESIMVWIEIKAPRYWWQEQSTYRVGTSNQSESTIHTIARTKLSQKEFEEEVLGSTIKFLNKCIEDYNSALTQEKKDYYFRLIKLNLPEGYLQKRLMCTNYKTLKNMIKQRKNHKLIEWHKFIEVLKNELEHPELIFVD